MVMCEGSSCTSWRCANAGSSTATAMILSSMPLSSVIEKTTDGSRADDRERNDGLLHQDEDVERVAVVGVRLRNEAVVGRVVNRGVKHAVEHE